MTHFEVRFFIILFFKEFRTVYHFQVSFQVDRNQFCTLYIVCIHGNTLIKHQHIIWHYHIYQVLHFHDWIFLVYEIHILI